MFKSFWSSICLWWFFLFIVEALLADQSVVCNHCRFSWDWKMSGLLHTESVRKRMFTVGSHFIEKQMLCWKFKLIPFWFLWGYSVYKICLCCYFQIWTPSALRSGKFSFLIVFWGRSLSKCYSWSSCLDHADFVCLPSNTCSRVLQKVYGKWS